MSGERNFFFAPKEKKIKGTPKLKDTMLLAGWILAILIIAGSTWAITQPVRNRFLIRAVNRVLEQSGDLRRLESRIPSGYGGSFISGTWYTITLARQSASSQSGERAFLFSFIGEGTFFPCAAIVNVDGKVVEFIPLNGHGERIMAQISPGILNLYTRRIEGAL